MRVLFMGTPEFAVPTLKAIYEAGHHIEGVVTQPDRPGGRGKKLRPSAVKQAALGMNLPLMQPEKVSEPGFIEQIRAINPEVVVVVAFGQILPPELLNLPRHGCINVHASLLPRYRGAAPIHRAVINGETETGVTTMFMDRGLDTGDMLLKASTPIYDGDNVGSVHDRLALIGAGLLVETLAGLPGGEIIRTPQDHGRATYAPMLGAADEMIVWEDSARSIFNLVRGMDPWPGARTNLEGKVLKIWRTGILPDYFLSNDEINKYSPGTVIKTGPEGLTVATGTGPLLVTEMQLQGGKRLAASDFLRGNYIAPGTVLKTAINKNISDSTKPLRHDPKVPDERRPATDGLNGGSRS